MGDKVIETKTLAEHNKQEWEKLPEAGLRCGMPQRPTPAEMQITGGNQAFRECDGKIRMLREYDVEGPPVQQLAVICTTCGLNGTMWVVKEKESDERE